MFSKQTTAAATRPRRGMLFKLLLLVVLAHVVIVDEAHASGLALLAPAPPLQARTTQALDGPKLHSNGGGVAMPLHALTRSPWLVLANASAAASAAMHPHPHPPHLLAEGALGADAPGYVRRLARAGYEVRRVAPPLLLLQPSAPLTAGQAAAGGRVNFGSGSSSSNSTSLRGLSAVHQQQRRQQQNRLPSLSSARERAFMSAADGGAAVDVPACARAFTAVGTQPRALAVILLKWRREYYPPKSECCPGTAASDPACDCTWGGYKYDKLPLAAAYARMFTDECDGFESMNRAFHRMSGGRVTFTSNATILSGRAALPDAGVDAYGWATLDAMRGADGVCRDWCADAMAQLNVSAKSHRHYVCLPLYAPDQAGARAPAVCDNLCPNGGDCAASCPADGPYSGLPGCGCGTCYWAWGGQWKCGPASRARRHTTGFAAPVATWSRNGPVRMLEGNKVYMAHELGHNLGATHAGSMVCKTDSAGAIDRRGGACRPDWYGDATTFMGGGSALTLPAFARLQQGWVAHDDIVTAGEVGRQVTVLLRDANAAAAEDDNGGNGGEGEDFGAGSSSSSSNATATNDATAQQQQQQQRPKLVLAARIPLPDPTEPAGYVCPCASGACAGAPTCNADAQCADGPCCTDGGSRATWEHGGCADGGFGYYYVEYTAGPPPRSYGGASVPRGVTIRLSARDQRDCMSTRLVAAHAAGGGGPRYALDAPDPSGKLPGSWFEDSVRRVIVRLDAIAPDGAWAQVSILRY